MTTPTIPAGNLFMNATLYTGTGAGQTLTNGVAGQSFQPDFVWIKVRSTTYDHNLYDSVRGVQNVLNSNGFTIRETSNYELSANGATYVAWQWKAGGTAVSNTSGTITSQVSANTTSGFSIVTYTGTGANATVGHGLGVAPSMIIIKVRSRGADDWGVYHQSLGNTGFLALNTTATNTTSNVFWNSTSPTSSVFSLGTNSNVNPSGQTLVAYCWSQIAGFSQFGSYTGNGSSDGPFVYLGFRPKFIMFQCATAGSNWTIVDTARSPYNAATLTLLPNDSRAEVSYANYDFLSNGFKIRGSLSNEYNVSGQTYIYAAFAENPFKYANAR